MIILYDTLYTWPESSPLESVTFPQPEFIEDNFKRLLEESVFQLTTSPQIPTEASHDSKTLKKYWRCHQIFRETQRNLRRSEFIEHLYNLASFSIYNQNFHPSVYNAPAYINALDVHRSDQIVNPLLQAYSIMSKAMSSEIEELQKVRGTESIVIPPIPSMILRKIDKPSQIIEELLSLRNKFKKVRDAFREYLFLINGKDVELKKSLSALSDFKKICDELSRTYDRRGVALISEWRDATDLLPKELSDVDSEDFDPKSIIKFLLGKPLSWVIQRIKRRKVLPLFGMKREFYNLTDHAELIRKIWRYEITKREINEAKRYLYAGDIAILGNQPYSSSSPPIYANRDYLGLNEPPTQIIRRYEPPNVFDIGRDRLSDEKDKFFISKILFRTQDPAHPCSILEPYDLFKLYSIRDKVHGGTAFRKAILHNILGGVGPGWYWLKDYSKDTIFDGLKTALKHKSWEIRWASVHYLSKLKRKDMIQFLWPLTEDVARKVKEYAIEAIANLYTIEDLPIFLPFLKELDFVRRRIAVTALSSLGKKEEIPMMIDILISGSRDEKIIIAKGLSRFKEPNVRSELLKVKQQYIHDFGVSHCLSMEIPKMFERSDIEHLLKILNVEGLTSIALDSLLMVVETEDKAIIEKALTDTPKGDVYSCLQIVLGKIQLIEGDPSFNDIFTHEDPDVQKYAVKLIGQYGSQHNRVLLESALKSDIHYIRGEAALSMKSILGREAIPFLVESAKNEKQDATHAAKKALLRLFGSDEFDTAWSMINKGIFDFAEEELIKFLANCIDFQKFDWLMRFIENDNWEGFFAREIITIADSRFHCPLEPQYEQPPWNEV